MIKIFFLGIYSAKEMSEEEMKKQNNRLVFFILGILLFVISCSRTNPNEPSEHADLPLNISLAPAIAMNIEIGQVMATITCGNYVDSMNLAITDSVASGIFEDLNPGFYNIVIQVFNLEGELVAIGSGSGEVVSGETTTAVITLEFVENTGNLEIIIEWGLFDAPSTILFLGNSYTASYGGMDQILTDLTTAAFEEQVLEADNVTSGGYTLEMHWNNPVTIEKIESGNWDLVILQEQSTRPVDNPELMYQYADSLCNLIRDNGAEPAFFMTWAREYDPDMIEPLAAAYNYCGTNFNSAVIACGRAFQKCKEDYPNIGLYSGDGSHPNQCGAYLAACMFFSELWQESPIGIEWALDETITDEERMMLQQCAWDTSLEY